MRRVRTTCLSCDEAVQQRRRNCRERPAGRRWRGAGPHRPRRLPERPGRGTCPAGAPASLTHVPDANGATEGPRSATDEYRAFRHAQGHSGATLAAACGQPEEHSPSSSLPSDSEDASASAPRSHSRPEFPRLAAPGSPADSRWENVHRKPRVAVSVGSNADSGNVGVGRPPTTKGTTIHGKEREGKA